MIHCVSHARCGYLGFLVSGISRFPLRPLVRPCGIRTCKNNSTTALRCVSEPLHSAESEPVQDLRIPEQWFVPSNTIQESEWLRITLLNWLNDEYCPEDTNLEISRVAAESFRRSLQKKEADLGVILLTMAMELESISYRESFHGAFSSANAAIDLISQRIYNAGTNS